MERAAAYDYHDRALDYVRSARAAAGSMFGMAEEDADVRIAIAVEDYASGESQVALRVRRLDQQTRAVIDQMIAEGWIPPSTPVEEIGELRGFGARDLVAPLLAGVSCANERGSRGTLGCFVRTVRSCSFCRPITCWRGRVTPNPKATSFSRRRARKSGE